MKVLFLGNNNRKLISFLKDNSCEVLQYSKIINVDFLINNNIEFIISYGYRYIINEEIINLFKNKIINLHISYLPFNRGASPNLWSVIDKTIKGITIHYMDKKIDTGDIIIQKEIKFNNNISLKESYTILKTQIEIVFIENWHKIKTGNIEPKKQNLKEGSFHTVKQTNEIIKKLGIKNWDMTFKDITNKI
jgi:methionyl-tRNA formyltransferase